TDDPHGGQFGPDCAACHTPDDWEAATFDHNLSAFPLTGAHSSAECELCHTGGVFAGTPQDCYSCHLTDDPHGGQFGPDCAACHTSTAWIPAGYTGPHTFPINHGESGPRACRTCHPDGLQTYTCYDCHEHTPAKIESKHREEGIRNFENCVQCHPTGREEEGEGEGD
ncbi:MAG: hypothetical protein ACE5G8_13075, partial [Anaerolineae bacterium]